MGKASAGWWGVDASERRSEGWRERVAARRRETARDKWLERSRIVVCGLVVALLWWLFRDGVDLRECPPFFLFGCSATAVWRLTGGVASLGSSSAAMLVGWCASLQLWFGPLPPDHWLGLCVWSVQFLPLAILGVALAHLALRWVPRIPVW